jgi:hypothetical protein
MPGSEDDEGSPNGPGGQEVAAAATVAGQRQARHGIGERARGVDELERTDVTGGLAEFWSGDAALVGRRAPAAAGSPLGPYQ